MKSIALRSPAKLNLFLKVTNKRKDGYHNLVTLFERVDLFDEIKISVNRTGAIRIFCKDREVPKGPRNLVFKAARLIKDDFALANGMDIYIKKRIPVAAGLAGGSSNAAAALMGINRLLKLSLSKKELIDYAKRIGSDVPFFLHNGSWALGKQRGDAVKPLKLRAKIWHVLVVPRLKVYSSQVFRALNLKLTKKNDNVNILIRALRDYDLSRAACFLRNDLESTIIRFHPNLLRVKDQLKRLGAQGVAFSGSGPSVFGMVHSKNEAKKIADVLRKRYKRVFVVKTF